MSINKEEIEKFPYLKKISEIFKKLNIETVELFWDETVCGKKPTLFSTYKISDESEELSSCDETETEEIEIEISVFAKDNFRTIKSTLIKELQEAGFFVEVGFETYEKDTKYKRFDLELKYINE